MVRPHVQNCVIWQKLSIYLTNYFLVDILKTSRNMKLKRFQRKSS